MKCNSCKYQDKREDEYPCNKCVHNAIEHYQPLTNLERIRNMSVEELASFICSIYDMGEDKFINGTIISYYNEYDIQEWLEREVEDDE